MRLYGMTALGLVCAIGFVGLGCGDDDDSTPDSGVIPGTGGIESGTGGMTSTGTGGMTSGTGGTSSGTGGMIAGAMCDSTVPTTAMCGTTSCPAPSAQAASLVCSVPCCLPDNTTCGFKRATMGAVGDCIPVATHDAACPDMNSGGMMLQGCCAVSGHCGVISSLDMTCITSSALLPMLMPGAACEAGAGDGGMADGGS